MSEFSKRRLIIVCCAAMALTFTACNDDSDSSQSGDPCDLVNCSEDQTCMDARCVDNACIQDGVEISCEPGKTCSKGQCVDDECENQECDDGWQCIEGICTETACIGLDCEEGQSCKGGTCVDNACLDKTCDEGMICSKGDCTYEICLDKTPCTIGKFCNAAGVCVFITPPAFSLDAPKDTTTDESGKSIMLTLHLNNAPTAEVRLNCEVITQSPNAEVNVACDAIVFNSDNWQQEQTIIVTGVEDYLKDGDQAYKLKITAVSEDEDFNGLSTESVELTNLDMTKPGFIFSETALTTNEDQHQEPATFTVKLSSSPSADVRLTLSSSDPDKGTVMPDTLVFTKDNWREAQTVTVHGIDNDERTGNQNYTIVFEAVESDDEDYRGMRVDALPVMHVDDDVAGVSIHIPEDFVIEEGHDTPILVKLNTKPKHDVTVTFKEENDTSEIDFGEGKLVLTPEDWNIGKSLHIMGIQDAVIDGDKPAKFSVSAKSQDPYYNLDPVSYDVRVKDMDTAELITTMSHAAIVHEGSPDFEMITLSLSSKPTANVDVDISVSDATELKVSKSTASISPSAWNYPLDIPVNSVDDFLVDGDQRSTVIVQLTSSDKNFNGLTKEVTFMTVDNDQAGLVISSNVASFSEDSGTSVGISVKLRAQPTANVTVNVTSSDATELTVAQGNVLTFTPANWDTDQQVTVTVADDSIADGTQQAYAMFNSTSTDNHFNGLKANSVIYSVVDNEAPSVILTMPTPSLSLDNPAGTAHVSLGVQPNDESLVTVSFSSSNPEVISFNPTHVTFDASTWNTPKEITITADFSKQTQASSTEWIQATASADSVYSDILSDKINMTLVKVPPVQNFDYSGSVQRISLPQGTYKLEVWGAQGGGAEDGNDSSGFGGRGGYSAGKLTLSETTTLYVRVGGKGGNAITGVAEPGWNGGGAAHATGVDDPGNGGGGATDIRIGEDTLYHRVIVAGGGGGGGEDRPDVYGHGGGWTAPMAGYSGYEHYAATHIAPGVNASFGIGADTNQGDGGGGGGGWYGGGTTQKTYQGDDTQGGGGGSGFVYDSSANSVAAVESVQQQTGQPYALDAQYKLTNAETRDGSVSMPAPGGGTQQGQIKNGFARISLVE